MLVNLDHILKNAKFGEKAVCAFNTPNLESIMAVISAAEENDFPVIISHAQIHESVVPLTVIAPCMITLAQNAKVDVCVHLDHGEDFDYVKKAIDLGFTSVMFDGSTLPYSENVLITKKVVEYARGRNVSVEAELGRLKGREAGGCDDSANVDLGEYTNPSLVGDFVEQTKVDALAICFGTAHGIYDKPPVLNLDVISEVVKVTKTPLVMHGGSGLSEKDYRNVIARGIRKINYYTYMSYEGYSAVVNEVQAHPKGFYHDLANVAQNAMKNIASQKIKLFKGE